MHNRKITRKHTETMSDEHIMPPEISRALDESTLDLVAKGSGAAPCSHDYDNPKRLGRLHYHCPKCDADISLDCFMIAEAIMRENENTTDQQP